MARKLDPERHETRRQTILQAAAYCFAEKGIHATSTAEICRVAEMSSGNLFYYFESKDAIVQALAERDRHEISQLLEDARTRPDALEGILLILETMLAISAEQQYARLSLELAVEAKRNPAVSAMFLANERQMIQTMVGLLEQGSRQGTIDADIDREKIALWLMSLADSAIGLVAVGRDFDPADHIATLRRIVLRTLAPPPANHSTRSTIRRPAAIKP